MPCNRVDHYFSIGSRACQVLLGHGKLESTVRYPGIEVDELEVSEQISL